MSIYEQQLKAFAGSISLQFPTEEEVDDIYQTFISNGSQRVDRFINDNGDNSNRDKDKRTRTMRLHSIRV